MSRYWTDDEIEFLKEFYPERGSEFVSQNTSKTRDSVRHKAKKLSLVYNHRKRWESEDEDNLIREHYPTGNIEYIEDILNLSKEKISIRARKLGLSRDDHFWNDEELSILRENYPHYTNRYLSEKFLPNRSPVNIRNMARRLGIYKTEEKSVKWYDAEKMLSDLWDLSQKLGRTPVWHELVPNGLASQKTYERYFGGYRKACGLLGLTENRMIFGRSTGNLVSKNGDQCLSYTEVFITNLLIDNNIDYVKEALYADVLNLDCFGKRKMDWYIPSKNIVIEYFGFLWIKNGLYEEKMDEKIALCKKHDVSLISLTSKEISKGKMDEVIDFILNKP